MPADIKWIKEHYERGKAKIANFLHLYQEIGDYAVPWRNTIIQTITPGTKLTDRIFDSTAPQALTTASSAIHGSVTPSNLRWFSVTVDDPVLLDETGVAIWLDDVSNYMFSALTNSNWDAEAQEIYSDLLAFGTGCMAVEEKEPISGSLFSGLRFHTHQPGSYIPQEGPDGIVDTVFRTFPMTVGSAALKWGLEKLSEDSQRCIEQGKSDQQILILQVIYPRAEETGYTKKNMQIASVWCELGHSTGVGGIALNQQQGNNLHIIDEGGFMEMPIMVPRWRKMSGEELGRSPLMNVLPTIRTLNTAVELRLKAWTLAVAPPLLVDDRGVIGNIRLTPFGRINKRPGATVEILDIPSRFDVANFNEEQLRQEIRSGLFVDLLSYSGSEGKSPTSATENAIKFQSMQRILGPVVSRLQDELLTPVLKRVYRILERRGVLPPPPGPLQNKELRLVFEGPLARVQRSADIEAVSQFFSLMFPLAEVSGDVLARVDFNEVLDILAHSTSLPARALRSKEEADAILSAQRQQQAQAMAQQQLLEAATVLQKGEGGRVVGG